MKKHKKQLRFWAGFNGTAIELGAKEEIGTVDSTTEELTKNICEMCCNKCGLEDNLSVIHKHVIGNYD